MEDNNIIKKKVISKISMSKFNEENIPIKNNNKFIYIKFGMVACICLIFSTGIVFAKDIENALKRFFNNSNPAMESAINNNYIQEQNTDYTFDNNIGIKVDKLIIDKYNLNLSFNYINKEKENIKSMRLKDFDITDENGKIVYTSNYIFVNNLEEKPIYTSMSWINEPLKLEKNIFEDSIIFGLEPSKSSFNSLYFNIKSFDITYKNEEKSVVEGNWNFKILINNEMRKNTTVIFNMVNDNEYIESCIGYMSPTGMIIELVSKKEIPTDSLMQDICHPIVMQDMIYLTNNEDKIYKSGFIDWNKHKMKIHFENIGTFTEKSDYLKLHLEFFNFIIDLKKDGNKNG